MRLYDNQPAVTVDRARTLRRAASPIERHLLRGLRGAFPHHKWRHQSPVGPFYADVLCFSERLVIEVDGDSHAVSNRYDADRTKVIEREGFQVIRFTNAEVTTNLEGVLTQISLALRERERTPSGRKGEGRLTNKAGEAQ